MVAQRNEPWLLAKQERQAESSSFFSFDLSEIINPAWLESGRFGQGTEGSGNAQSSLGQVGFLGCCSGSGVLAFVVMVIGNDQAIRRAAGKRASNQRTENG